MDTPGYLLRFERRGINPVSTTHHGLAFPHYTTARDRYPAATNRYSGDAANRTRNGRREPTPRTVEEPGEVSEHRRKLGGGGGDVEGWGDSGDAGPRQGAKRPRKRPAVGRSQAANWHAVSVTELKPRTAAVGRVVAYLLDGVPRLPGEDLDQELGDWLTASSRFGAFAEAHRDKIRKKLRTAKEPEARGDVRAELEAAFLLLADRRIELAFEAYGSGRRGPDFTVTLRSAHRFNLEVTRPRARTNEPDRVAVIGQAVLAKLRQFPVETPNALLVATGLASSPEDIAGAMRALKLRADRRDEDFFAARSLTSGEFQQLYRRLAAVLVGDSSGAGVCVWVNAEARRKLPGGALNACVACLANARWAVEPTHSV